MFKRLLLLLLITLNPYRQRRRINATGLGAVRRRRTRAGAHWRAPRVGKEHESYLIHAIAGHQQWRGNRWGLYAGRLQTAMKIENCIGAGWQNTLSDSPFTLRISPSAAEQDDRDLSGQAAPEVFGNRGRLKPALGLVTRARIWGWRWEAPVGWQYQRNRQFLNHLPIPFRASGDGYWPVRGGDL